MTHSSWFEQYESNKVTGSTSQVRFQIRLEELLSWFLMNPNSVLSVQDAVFSLNWVYELFLSLSKNTQNELKKYVLSHTL